MIEVGVQVVSIDPGELRGLARNGVGEIPLGDAGSLGDAMRLIGLKPEIPYMTLVNGQPVSPEDRDTRTLANGDQIVVFPPIEGG